MAFFNLCCRSGGSNLNAGTRKGDSTEPGTSPSFTYASGSWVAATGVFTVASGNPSTDGVVAGDFASVYADGSTETGFIGRVTAVTSTTITVSLTVRTGTPPTDGTGNRTLRIGGAWAGPSGSVTFPFNLTRISELVPTIADRLRINLKNDQTYAITATLNPETNTLSCALWGYSSSYGDSGRAKLDGGTTGASFVLFSGARPWQFRQMEFCNNGATGSAHGITNTGYFQNCIFHDFRGGGSVNASVLFQCELYNCNQSNTALCGAAMYPLFTDCCMIHDNAGSNTAGIFSDNGQPFVVNTIVDSNGGIGIRINNGFVDCCDVYNNGSHGFSTGSASGTGWIFIRNTNMVKNGGWGISPAMSWNAFLQNCGFGSGSQANTSGKIAAFNGTLQEIGTVDYASGVTPWADPVNGDFRITLAAARNAGDMSFLQTQLGYSGTVGYVDIGAAQSQSGSGGGASGFSLSRLINLGG